MIITVGIGEGAFSDNPGTIIKTYALGSCIAVTGYSRVKKAGGLIHCVLPDKSVHNTNHSKPWFYIETAIPLFLKRMELQYGCSINDLEIKMFGGATSTNGNDVFNIGSKNAACAKRMLKQMNARLVYTDISGNISRTVELDINTGETYVRSCRMIV